MSNRIQIRRDSALNWANLNPILADGEPGLNIDNNQIKYGDGETPWNALMYTGEDIPPYRGFKASYGRVYDNGSSNETTLSKIVIYKASVTPTVTIDDDGGNSDLFKVDGLMGSDFVAIFVLYGDTNARKETSVLLSFTRAIIDNVIYDNQGQIRNINNLRSAFYDQNTILHNSAGGLISNFRFLNGGNWPTEYINDGGNDQYDNANYIYTDITGDGYIGSSTGAVPYNGGNINDGTSYFGSGSNYVVTYQDSIFGLFVTGANFNSINTNGGSGADGSSTTDCGSLFDVGFIRSNTTTSSNQITNTSGGNTYSVSVGTDGVVTMTTSRGGLEFGALPEPGGTQHFHIMRPAGDTSTDLFFGDDYNYVRQRPAQYQQDPAYGVEIGTHDRNGGSQHVWRFETDGYLELPGGGFIGLDSGFGTTIGAGMGDHFNIFSGGYYWHFGQSGNTTSFPENSIVTNNTELKIATSPTTTYTFNEAYWAALHSPRISTPTNNAQYFSCGVEANQNGTYTVSITGPGNSFTPGNWFKIPGNELGGSTPANDLQITVASVNQAGVILTTTVTGTAVGKEWTFGRDGSTSFPNNTIKSPTVAQVGYQFTIATGVGGATNNNGASGVTLTTSDDTALIQVGWTAQFANYGPIAVDSIYVNEDGTRLIGMNNRTGFSATLPVTFTSPNYAPAYVEPIKLRSDNHEWTFGADSALTLPETSTINISGSSGGFFATGDTDFNVDLNGKHWSFDAGSGQTYLPFGLTVAGDISNSEDLVLKAGQETWTFGTDGNLTFPQGSAIDETAGVSTNIKVNGKAWAFGTDGKLTLPTDGTISYTPANSSDWAGDPPTTIQEAIDRIVASLQGIQGVNKP